MSMPRSKVDPENEQRSAIALLMQLNVLLKVRWLTLSIINYRVTRMVVEQFLLTAILKLRFSTKGLY